MTWALIWEEDLLWLKQDWGAESVRMQVPLTGTYLCLCLCRRFLGADWDSGKLALRLHGLQPARLVCPWDFPGKNAGVGCHFLQGIFPTQGSNLGLLHHCRDFLKSKRLPKNIPLL